MDNCYFCNCINNHNFIIENELAVGKFDEFPVNEGHFEVVTRRHVIDWWNTTKEEKTAIFDLIDTAKEIIDKKYNPDGYNIGMNLGKYAGQSVMHLHVHLIPRYKGDVSNPRGGVRGVIPNKQNY